MNISFLSKLCCKCVVSFSIHYGVFYCLCPAVSEGLCYLGRGCAGETVPDSEAAGMRTECCVPGAGLSFYSVSNSLCQECFSMYKLYLYIYH